jgi:hypothetical protein
LPPADWHRDTFPSVLARRLGETIAHHEPGWPLPRASILSRTFDVAPADLVAALRELESVRFITRQPGGRFRRTIPSEVRFTVVGQASLRARVTFIGTDLTCTHRTVSWRPIRHHIERALGMDPGQDACVIRMTWTSACETVGLSTTYLTSEGAAAFTPTDDRTRLDLQILAPFESARSKGDPCVQAAQLGSFHAEMQHPPGWAATALCLPALGQAMIVTAAYTNPGSAAAMAVTTAILRPDAFRLTAWSPAPALSSATLPTALTDLAEDDEPDDGSTDEIGPPATAENLSLELCAHLEADTGPQP